jgi:hypothetical protein
MLSRSERRYACQNSIGARPKDNGILGEEQRMVYRTSFAGEHQIPQ